MPKPRTVWRHYKGNVYVIVDVATHTEDDCPMVIYRARYGNRRRTWARPLAMWYEDVGGVPRFEPIAEYNRREGKPNGRSKTRSRRHRSSNR